MTHLDLNGTLLDPFPRHVSDLIHFPGWEPGDALFFASVLGIMTFFILFLGIPGIPLHVAEQVEGGVQTEGKPMPCLNVLPSVT